VRDERGEVDVSRCKEVHLLETGDSLGLHDGVLVILHHRAADEARQTRRRYHIRIACSYSHHDLSRSLVIHITRSTVS